MFVLSKIFQNTMACEEMFSVNLARRLEKLPTPGLNKTKVKYLPQPQNYRSVHDIIFSRNGLYKEKLNREVTYNLKMY